VDLLRGVEEVLVVEELSPFLEERLQALCHREGLRTRVLGKHSGHLPEEFEYEPEVIARGLHRALGLGAEPAAPREAPPAPPRPPVLCPGCPHRSSYFAVRAAFPEETLYFSDIGCYTLGYGPPLDTADAVLCMGAAFTLAGGVSRVTNQRTVGFMGDSTFFHAGMPPLLNAIKEDVNMVAVILDNDVTAMTGFQESPTISVVDGTPRRETSIEGVARALGARHVEVVDPMDPSVTIAAFERARDHTGVSVIISRHSCPMFLARETGAVKRAVAYEIDHERCRTCGR